MPKLGLLEQWIETTPSGRINPYWIQVCASLADPRVKKSEVHSLSEAMVELAVGEGVFVTLRTDETIPVGFGFIQVVPVWRFLLEMDCKST